MGKKSSQFFYSSDDDRNILITEFQGTSIVTKRNKPTMALSLSWQLIKRTKPEVGVIQGGWDSIFECRGVSPRGGSVNVSGAARPRWQEKWLSRNESHFCRYWEMWLIDNKPKNLNQIQYQNPVSWDMELGAGLGHTQARLKVTGQIIGIYAINRTSVKNLSIFIRMGLALP